MQQQRMHATTILCVRRDGKVAMGGDGQVTVGETVMKAHANKVRPLREGKVVAGFAGAAADAFTLFERLEEKLERYPGNLSRAAVELCLPGEVARVAEGAGLRIFVVRASELWRVRLQVRE